MIKTILLIFLCVLLFIGCILLSVGYTGKKLSTTVEDSTYYDKIITAGLVLFILDIVAIVGYTYYYYYYFEIDDDDIVPQLVKVEDLHKSELAKKLLDATTKENALDICTNLVNTSNDIKFIEQFNDLKIKRPENEVLNLCKNYSKHILKMKMDLS